MHSNSVNTDLRNDLSRMQLVDGNTMLKTYAAWLEAVFSMCRGAPARYINSSTTASAEGFFLKKKSHCNKEPPWTNSDRLHRAKLINACPQGTKTCLPNILTNIKPMVPPQQSCNNMLCGHTLGRAYMVRIQRNVISIDIIFIASVGQ